MKVVVVVRMTADYAGMDLDAFKRQLEDPYKPRTELQIMISNQVPEVWNESFSMTYQQYRRRMAMIARDNHEATGCEVLRGYEQFIDWYNSDKEEALVVPVDDDDWFSPELKSVADSLGRRHNLIYWPNSVLSCITRHRFHHNDYFKLASNNWGIRKSYLKTMDDKLARHTILLSHYHTSKRLTQTLVKEEICFLNKYYNLYNRHVGSLAFLREKIDELDIKKELPKIAKRPVVPCPTPKGLEWIGPYLERLHSLCLAIRKERTILL